MTRMPRLLCGAVLFAALSWAGLLTGTPLSADEKSEIEVRQNLHVPARGGRAGFGFPGSLFVQGFPGGIGQGFPGGGQGFPGGGQGFPGGGQGFPGGIGQGFPGGGQGFPGGGTQGGTFPRGGMFGMAPGATVMASALCLDLFNDPPAPEKTYGGGEGGMVTLADGSLLPLPDAIDEGMLEIRGASNRPYLLGRSSPEIKFEFRNLTRQPLRVQIPSGANIFEEGRASMVDPELTAQLFEAAGSKRVRDPRQLQLAVWAVRGQSPEDVEQTTFQPVREAEMKLVRDLTSDGNVRRAWEAVGNRYASRLDQLRQEMEGPVQEIHGRTFVGSDEKARVTVWKDASGAALARLTMSSGLIVNTRASIQSRSKGRHALTLTHLQSGRPVRLPQRALLLSPVPVEAHALPAGKATGSATEVEAPASAS